MTEVFGEEELVVLRLVELEERGLYVYGAKNVGKLVVKF